MKEKVIIVVQCRADSTRLPRKIIRAISDDGKSCLQYLCERLNTAHYNTVVATTDRKEDTCIEKEFDDAVLDRYPHVLKVFKGSYENIAQRLYDASKGYEYIVRVTGDDLFTDIDCLHKLVDYGVAGKYDYTYQQGMIRGADCELIKRSALRRVLDKFPGEPIEHLEHYLKNDDFTIGCAPYPPVYSESSGIRLTLDNEKDYELCRIVYSSLYPLNPVFSLLDVVVFFNKYKWLKMLNFVPPISVYLVHRNYSDFVSDAIASVLGQTFRDFELIIVDYGSDHLGHVDPILKFLPNEKIKFYRIAEEITFIEAIQFALQRCRGRYVLRMDADDLLTPGALEALHKYLETHPEFSMVVPNYYEMIGDKKTRVIKGEETNLPSQALIERKKLDYVRYNEGQKFRDGTSLFETFKKFGFKTGYYRKTPLFYHRIHENSLTHGQFTPEEIAKADREIIDNVGA